MEVCSHLESALRTAGVKYLRENNIVHRDVKPANILKFICEDKGSIYKLSDFGAARFLEDDQQFMSYYGTEEYLEPDLYQTAVLKQPEKKSFGATVDLWSFSITLYHVATGCVPFRPFEGRASKHIMYHLISQKPPGTISGVENANGTIDWRTELPESCSLSQGVKDLIVILLACLLERKMQNMWTFDNLFDYVSNILSRKVFHIFYMNEGKEFSLYMEPHKKFQDLTDGIFIETNVPSSSQLLLFEKSPLLSQIDHSCCVSTMPKTSVDNPIILVHIENTGVIDLKQINVTFPNQPPDIGNIKNFVSLAEKFCSTAYIVKRMIIKLVRCRQLLLQIPKILIPLSTENVRKLCSVSDVLKLKLDAVRYHYELFEKTSTLVSQFSSIWPNVSGYENFKNIRTIVTEKKISKDQVEKEVIQLLSSISVLKERVLISKCLQNEWEKKSSECFNLVRGVERADAQVEKMCRSLQMYKQIKTSEVFHQGCVLESLKLENAGKKLSALQDECWNACLQILNKLYEWYHCMQTVMVQCRYLEEALDSATNNLRKFSSSLHETEFEIFQCATKFISTLTPPTDRSEQILPNLNASSLSQLSIRKESTKRSIMQHEEILLKFEIVQKSHKDLQKVTEENKSLIESFAQNMSIDCNMPNPLQPVPALSSSHCTLHG